MTNNQIAIKTLSETENGKIIIECVYLKGFGYIVHKDFIKYETIGGVVYEVYQPKSRKHLFCVKCARKGKVNEKTCLEFMNKYTD